MTPADQLAQRIRQLQLQLEIADYGMGMPRDYERVLELRAELAAAKEAASIALLATMIDSDFGEDK